MNSIKDRMENYSEIERFIMTGKEGNKLSIMRPTLETFGNSRVTIEIVKITNTHWLDNVESEGGNNETRS